MPDRQDKKEQIRSAYENRIDVEYIPPKISQQTDETSQKILQVAPYCRVSTNSEDQLASYETQIQAYKEYVSKHSDWELVDIYADEGISGTSTRRRDDFRRMIDDCKKGKIDMIITKNTSRFARNVVDCVVTARMLKGLNPPVAIFFEDVGINTLTQTGELLLVILAAIAQGESETKSASVKWGFQKRFEAGLPKISLLYGYIKDGRDLYISEKEAAVVRLIYQMFVDGYSILHISRVLNSQAIPSPRNGQWSCSTIRSILTNEKYCGDVVMQKTVTIDLFSHKSVKNDGRAAKYRIKNHHDAIVDKQLWLKAQEILATKGNRQYEWENFLDDSVRLEGRLANFSVVRMINAGGKNEYFR